MTLQFETRRIASASAHNNALGGALLGAAQGMGSAAWPEQHLRVPVLSPADASLRECWLSDGPLQQGIDHGIRWCRNGDMLYGVIALDETQDPAQPGVSPLQATSHGLYARLFKLLREQGMPHLWRVWNYVARINEDSHGLERYRQFNLGRYEAFVQAQQETGGQVPAACALGVREGALSVAFLAGVSPVVSLENPRQVSAWAYPSVYGPRAPTFSRAALAYPPGQEVLFISGTASIVGHETLHAGDVVAQCRETVRNLEAVVQEANRLARSAQAFELRRMSHRVYLRHARDAEAVQRVLGPLLSDGNGGAEVVFVQADVCRADLLVEIESHAIHALSSASSS
ncbi:hypothetical protein [Hydrogenophaga sp.]|uniref:chorismate transformation enzyme, FkbO/Hyg5 family n=1 Tax=Hydrogenophaga sp. TaxID=1904254 RepID=UPI00271FE4D3|nr:hypothetical protein [Hydrogenophaga sp.]MDO9436780.1 hypothetical protein [Hydrogenophaga sp.]